MILCHQQLQYWGGQTYLKVVLNIWNEQRKS